MATIKIAFNKLFESKGLSLEFIKNHDEAEAILVVTSPDGKVPLAKDDILALMQFFESAFKDMNKEKA